LRWIGKKLMMLSSTDPVPAVLESEAEGEILEIFRDIKGTTGADVINLIWRHLAITPGALQVVWKMLRPVYKSGLVLTEAKTFRETLSLPKIQPLSKQALLACGVDNLGYINITNILKSYNQTNSINLIGLSAALACIESDSQHRKETIRESSYELLTPLAPLPPLPAMSDLDKPVQELVQHLNNICEEDGRIIASMYRHLAYWPGYLGLIHTLLSPYENDTHIKSIIASVRSEAYSIGMGIAQELKPFDSSVDKQLANVIKGILNLFVEHPLSKMAVLCGALLAATPVSEQ